ncbi:hypothetical protein F5H01DRAFT_346873 [Linnemannia elongata]|nr:hypothetical protein F5H01DRAFT_346873 [Linnemannia elongata]
MCPSPLSVIPSIRPFASSQRLVSPFFISLFFFIYIKEMNERNECKNEKKAGRLSPLKKCYFFFCFTICLPTFVVVQRAMERAE